MLDADGAEEFGVAADAATAGTVGLDAPESVAAPGLLGANADRADRARQRLAVAQRLSGRRAIDAADELDAIEAQAAPATAEGRLAEPLGGHEAEIAAGVEHQPQLVARDTAAGKIDVRERDAERDAAQVPDHVGMRAQHQAAPRRRAAATATAGIDAQLDADRPDEPLPPGDFATEREEAAVAATGRAVDGRPDGQAGKAGDVDEIAGADEADARPVAGKAHALEAEACMRRRDGERRCRGFLPGRCQRQAGRRRSEQRRSAGEPARHAAAGSEALASSQSTATWANERRPSSRPGSSM